MNLSRRGTLLGASAIVASGAAVLFGCSTQTTSQLQTDAQTLAAGVQAIVADVQAIPGVTIPPATLAQIQAAASDVSTNAAAIASTLSPSTSVVQGISTAIATLGTLLTPFFPAAPLIVAAVSAAVTLAPRCCPSRRFCRRCDGPDDRPLGRMVLKARPQSEPLWRCKMKEICDDCNSATKTTQSHQRAAMIVLIRDTCAASGGVKTEGGRHVMNRCTNCGYRNYVTVPHCFACGSQQPPPSPAPRKAATPDPTPMSDRQADDWGYCG